MSSRDFLSQLQLSEAVIKRFHNTASKRQVVKDQLMAGRTPSQIESKEKVERRAKHIITLRGKLPDTGFDLIRESSKPLSQSISQLPPQALERIIGGNDLISANFLHRGAAAASSVCCIREGEVRIGTGFLVGERILLTNAHVIPNQDIAKDCTAEFDFEDSLEGSGVAKSTVFKLSPKELFVVSPENKLDYALMAVEPTSGSKRIEDYAFLKINPVLGKILRGESVNIIQHPNGAPKRVALRQNKLTALLENFMHYEADTEPGSSGSPVFNDQWEVICLHHSGVPLTDSQGNILTRNNQIWNRDQDDPALIRWIGNEGIRISRIVNDVAKQVGGNGNLLLADFPKPAPSSEGDEINSLDDTSPGTMSSSIKHSTKNPIPSSIKSKKANAPLAISFPFELTLSVDKSGKPFVASITSSHQVISSNKISPLQSEPDNLVERGLKNLERSQTRAYFDKQQNDTDSANYYANIDPQSDSFSDSIHTLISNSHENQLSYRVARIEHLYAWVDLQRDKMVRSIYSDERFDPSRFIQQDFVLERRVEQRIAKRQVKESPLSELELERLFAAFEAQEPFNCEHVVPQSWFEREAPMQGDLHHLFACQNQCNSFRSNKPYANFGKFPIAPEGLRPQCGFSEEGLFEPFMGKGKVARATLYFLIRYPDQFENRYEELDQGIATLLDWHSTSPITEHEQHRNQAIFEIQGNRNPFIDHPEWASFIFS